MTTKNRIKSGSGTKSGTGTGTGTGIESGSGTGTRSGIELEPKSKLDLGINAMFQSDAIQSSSFDTIKAKFQLKHKPIAKKLPYKNSKGKVTTRIALKLHNKHGNTLLVVRSSVDGTLITIDGSYIKWLTGQNIFGSEDLISLCVRVFKAVCLQLEIQPSAEELAAVKAGKFKF